MKLVNKWIATAILPMALLSCEDKQNNPYENGGGQDSYNSGITIDAIQKGDFFDRLDDGAYEINIAADKWSGDKDLTLIAIKDYSYAGYKGYAGLTVVSNEIKNQEIDSAAVVLKYQQDHPELFR